MYIGALSGNSAVNLALSLSRAPVPTRTSLRHGPGTRASRLCCSESEERSGCMTGEPARRGPHYSRIQYLSPLVRRLSQASKSRHDTTHCRSGAHPIVLSAHLSVPLCSPVQNPYEPIAKHKWIAE